MMTQLRRRSGLVAGILGILLALGMEFAYGEDVTSREYQIKAAFLYNFAKFVEWPAQAFAGPSTPLSLCILGPDPFGPILEETLQGKTAQGRTLTITRYTTLPANPACHMLFISAATPRFLEEQFAALNGSAVLTVGDTDRFAHRGGIMNFTIDENKILVEINRPAAARAGLKISSQLLGLATLVPDQSGN